MQAREDAINAAKKQAATNVQNTKDNIEGLLHLFKDPAAQVHLLNLYGILSHAELDARETADDHSDATNPLSCFAEM